MRGQTRALTTTREQLRDDLMTMLIAGHETTAAVLTWTTYLLAVNPEAGTFMLFRSVLFHCLFCSILLHFLSVLFCSLLFSSVYSLFIKEPSLACFISHYKPLCKHFSQAFVSTSSESIEEVHGPPCPEEARLAAEEVDAVVADPGGVPTVEEIRKLERTRLVLAEAMRLYPAPPILIRRRGRGEGGERGGDLFFI